MSSIIHLSIFQFAGSSNVCVSNTSSGRANTSALGQPGGLTTRQQSSSNNSTNNNITTAPTPAITAPSTDSPSNGVANSKDASVATNAAIRGRIQLTDMPVEIFDKIFSYTGYKEVSNMRLVRKEKYFTKTIEKR